MSEHRINCLSRNGNLEMNISRQRRTEGRLLSQRLWALGCDANRGRGNLHAGLEVGKNGTAGWRLSVPSDKHRL